MQEKIASNKYGILYLTTEGFHINGDKELFLKQIKKDLKSNDPFAQICAQTVINIIETRKEI